MELVTTLITLRMGGAAPTYCVKWLVHVTQEVNQKAKRKGLPLGLVALQGDHRGLGAKAFSHMDAVALSRAARCLLSAQTRL